MPDPMPTGRLVLTPQQRAVADELFATLSAEELVALAKALPFAEAAARNLWWRSPASPWVIRSANDLVLVLGTGAGLSAASDYRRYLVAAYCGCAAQNGMAKLLTEMLELKKAEKVLVDRIGELGRTAAERGLTQFLVAFKGEADGDEHGVPRPGADQAGVPGGDQSPALGRE